MEHEYPAIDPASVEQTLITALNNAQVGDPHADWPQIAVAAAIAKLAIAVERSNDTE